MKIQIFKNKIDMKTIEVTDEMYSALTAISKELNTQSHRCTRMPYMIQVSTKVEVPAYEGCGESIWVDEDGDTLRAHKDVEEYFVTRDDDEYIFEKLDSLEDYEDALIDCNHGWRMVEVTESTELNNFFFTNKGLKDYYGDDVKTYLTGVNNPELETVMKFLCELSGGKLHV